jgi:hypothetical protein
MPIVIRPENSRFGQFVTICFTRSTHKVGSTPNFAARHINQMSSLRSGKTVNTGKTHFVVREQNGVEHIF